MVRLLINSGEMVGYMVGLDSKVFGEGAIAAPGFRDWMFLDRWILMLVVLFFVDFDRLISFDNKGKRGGRLEKASLSVYFYSFIIISGPHVGTIW